MLLNSLPDSYEHLPMTLIYGKDSIKFEDVSNALMNNELCKRDKQAQSDTSEALTRKRVDRRAKSKEMG